LAIGLGSTLLITLIGTALGVVAGWRGGRVDGLIRRVGDVVLAVPLVVGLILILSVLVAGQRSPLGITLAFSALIWPTAARVSRSATRAIKTQPYIEAARAVGASDLRILVRHVIPNALPTIIAFATPLVGFLIAAEATLSYLGVGMQSPAVSWGLMIDHGQPHYATSPHLLIFPGLFLAASVAGFILLGDAINDSAGPHQ
jgi:ABC-type dipeptide/oligopeptide/nickel transport system permease subunit